jgi:hypothetical protein
LDIGGFAVNFQSMCNRVVQDGVVIKPGGRATVLMRGPQGDFELPYTEAIFGGPARQESRSYWIQREGAEDVLVPRVSRFGEKHPTTGEQGWEDVPPDSALEGLLLPQPPGKTYRLLKSSRNAPPRTRSRASATTRARSEFPRRGDV